MDLTMAGEIHLLRMFLSSSNTGSRQHRWEKVTAHQSPARRDCSPSRGGQCRRRGWCGLAGCRRQAAQPRPSREERRDRGAAPGAGDDASAARHWGRQSGQGRSRHAAGGGRGTERRRRHMVRPRRRDLGVHVGGEGDCAWAACGRQRAGGGGRRVKGPMA